MTIMPSQVPFSDPIEIIVATVLMTLLGRWIIDLIRAPTVTVKKCEEIRVECAKDTKALREKCQTEIKTKLKEQGDFLDNGDDRFVRIEGLVCLSLRFAQRLCKEANINCEDLVDEMTRMGLMK
jgi:hypothetical protein